MPCPENDPGWEENTNRINSLEAQGTLLIQDESLLQYLDRDGSRYSSQHSTFSFHKQGEKLRFEIAQDRDFIVDTGTVKRVGYHVPFGVYGFLESGDKKKDAAKWDAIIAAHGVGGLTERTLVVGDKRYQHDVEENMAYIDEASRRKFLSNERRNMVRDRGVCQRLDVGRTNWIDQQTHPLAPCWQFHICCHRDPKLDGIYTMNESLTWSPKGVQRTGKNMIRVDSTKGWSVVYTEGRTNGELD